MEPLTSAAGSELWSRAKRIVVKVGSALLVDDRDSVIRRAWLDALVQDLMALKNAGREILIVSSGAVAVGRRLAPNFPAGRVRLHEKQALAAVGQVCIANAWQEAFRQHGVSAGQLLLTLDDSENRRRYLNARSCIETLVGYGAVPVINENDTITTQEIRFGDNDRLAARVAQMASADVLVLLSDIDGLYTSDPSKDPDAVFVPEVRHITHEIAAMAGEPTTAHGTGGMVTKLIAARLCMEAGCAMVIARGSPLNPLARLGDGARCTWFLPRSEPHSTRKAWISGSLGAEGRLHLDEGAVGALRRGRSLLPAGVRSVEGDFQRGAAVEIVAPDGRILGKGLIAYPSDEARLLAGHRTADIESLVGYRGKDELIHRDDMALNED
ncbi:glutamate 5-kinase [Phaeovibrio sulfidiphilus]|uniref:Glutamate 5-kinase n=1 Tax=Phaeovibrio sulfidiphilus TaxID=1220600 RepID=A0A8J7CCY6_9PROT|nr:glutamate 5-kinase [Phaeovibrio sulfidiphilus]MBE1236364.1 glutamate 5-kinase [Phaeovibrio sulfidiphilus]